MKITKTEKHAQDRSLWRLGCKTGHTRSWGKQAELQEDEKIWLVVQNLRIALSRVFIFFEAFRLTHIKKDRQNGEHKKGRVFIEGAEL